ncbi:MAG: hypothetical protein KIT09_20575 [Bryobacteraceae bacterium]|nr:hypothetical protein [Bryobacteraceae bacterium]
MIRLGMALLACAAAFASSVPTPEEHLGFRPGDDYKLADYAEISGYFQKLDAGSDRMRLVEFGRSSHGKPMYVAFISDAANLERLDSYREISRRMALGLGGEEEAEALAREGKAVVWVDSGLHASEVAPAQHAPVLAHTLVTSESEEARRIRESVILMQVPVINPDGLDWIVEWYRRNLGTPHEIAPLPRLYQKYAGHDNNRDWFMLNLTETRHVTRLLFQEWFPQIVYNQHQQPPYPARIFVPPYADPLNPNIPAALMEGVNLIGAAMKERFARENKPGVLSYHGFDGWWNGGLRTAPAFHNMHGILTETAAGFYATPRQEELKDFPARFSNGLPTREPSIFYPKPWTGGKWGVREAIDYMLTADFAILAFAASHSGALLKKAHHLARESIEDGKKGNPYAYVVPEQQWDSYSAIEMLRRLQAAGIQAHRARAPFTANSADYPAGTYVLLAAQPFRPYLIDLMEPQRYPELRTGADGPTKRPYDVAGWTLRMSMGVDAQRVDAPFEADLEPMDELAQPAPSLDHRSVSSFLATVDLLDRGVKVRWAADGEILAEGRSPREAFAAARFELRRPRVALYEPWVANMDAGWTQWVLDEFRIPYALLRDEEVRQGRFGKADAIILASQRATSILHGYRRGQPNTRTPAEIANKAIQRLEYTGGIGVAGLGQLERFVAGGGMLIAFDAATDLAVDFFPLGVDNVLRAASSSRYYCPGSLLRINVNNASPLAFGMPVQVTAFSTGGRAWEIELAEAENTGDQRIESAARYAGSDVLASGWLSGEDVVKNRHILLDARYGKGRVVLFGFRPQFRGQTFGTFKFLLNAIYLASAKILKE